jgi:hypothetical protein
MPWTWSGQTLRGTGPQKYPALVAAPLVTTGRSPREVPSICRATVGGGAARWQAATAGGRVGRRFGVGPRICALARVTYESKDNAGHKFWVARYGRYAIRIDATRPGVYPWFISLEGRSIRKAVVPDRDQAADAVSGTLDELPARCRRCDPSPIANCTAARQTAVDLHVEVRSVCRCLSSLVGLRRPGDGLGCR